MLYLQRVEQICNLILIMNSNEMLMNKGKYTTMMTPDKPHDRKDE